MGAYDPVDALTQGVSNGIKESMVSIGDDLFNISGAQDSNLSYGGQLLLDISTYTYNPAHDPVVVSNLQHSALLYVLFLLSFIFVGGAWVQFSRLRPTREFLGQKIESTTTSSYFTSVFYMIILGPILPVLMYIVLIFNKIICSLVMMGIMPSIMPTLDNATLYLGMGAIYAVLSLSFIWRALVLGILFSYCLVVLVLWAVPCTRGIGATLFTYYIIMVLMQPVILVITCIGVGIIQFLFSFNPIVESAGYLVLGLMLFTASLVFILGPFTIMKLLKSVKDKALPI